MQRRRNVIPLAGPQGNAFILPDLLFVTFSECQFQSGKIPFKINKLDISQMYKKRGGNWDNRRKRVLQNYFFSLLYLPNIKEVEQEESEEEEE